MKKGLFDIVLKGLEVTTVIYLIYDIILYVSVIGWRMPPL